MKKTMLLIAAVLTGCAAPESGDTTTSRIVTRYCEIPEDARLFVRYGVENDLACLAGYVAPASAALFLRGYCATNYLRPAIKDLVARDVCGAKVERAALP